MTDRSRVAIADGSNPKVDFAGVFMHSCCWASMVGGGALMHRSLITRRSQVQILPPPPTGKPGISRDSGLSTFSGEVGVYRVDLPAGSADRCGRWVLGRSGR